jgi:hypothetical protein
MKTQNHSPAAETRTPAEKQLDEAAAAAAESGNWEGFETEELLTEEGAKQVLEHCRNLTPNALLAEVTKQPFRWKHLVFRVVRCEYTGGEAKVEALPPDPQFIAEVTKRIEQNRFHVLPYYQGFGFISFPEDYLRYQE